MSEFIQQQMPVLRQTQALREELLSILTDEDLAYQLPGDNPTLGALCVEMGQVQASYSESFRTFKQDFAFAPAPTDVDSSVEKLRAWYQTLDAELDAALNALTDDDVQNRVIERGFPAPIGVQFHIYREGLLIFHAKASVYLRALRKTFPTQMNLWIG